MSDTLPALPRRRHASFAHLLPSRGDVLRHRRAVLAISLNHQNYASDKLLAIVHLMRAHFDESTLLVGDSIYRLTLLLHGGEDETLALAEAQALADEFIDNRRAVLDPGTPGMGHVAFLRCSDLWHDPDVGVAMDQLNRHLDVCEDFRRSVDAFAQDYLCRVGVATENARLTARRYLLEELALFSALAQRGQALVLYAGRIRTLADIVQGACGDVRHLFPDLAFGSVRLD